MEKRLFSAHLVGKCGVVEEKFLGLFQCSKRKVQSFFQNFAFINALSVPRELLWSSNCSQIVTMWCG